MKRLLIVRHSRTGGAAQMADAAAELASHEAGVDVRMLGAEAADASEVVAADGFLFVAPENLAGLSGPMKDFFDRCYYPALGRLNGRPYGVMICAGSDGAGAVRQVERIATGWRLRAVAAPLIVRTGAQTAEAIAAAKVIAPADLARCAELGGALAAGLALGVF